MLSKLSQNDFVFFFKEISYYTATNNDMVQILYNSHAEKKMQNFTAYFRQFGRVKGVKCNNFHLYVEYKQARIIYLSYEGKPFASSFFFAYFKWNLRIRTYSLLMQSMYNVHTFMI